MRKLLNRKLSFCMMIVSWLALLGCRTFVGLSGYNEGIMVGTFFLRSGLAVLATFFGGGLIVCWIGGLWLGLEDPLECDEGNQPGSGLINSLCAVLGLAGIYLLSFSVEEWSSRLNLFGNSTYMEMVFLTIKKYIYDIILIIVFPLWSGFILKKIRENGIVMSAVIPGIVQILMLTMMEFLLYIEFSNIQLVELAFVNTVTLIVEIKFFIWDGTDKKGDVVAATIGYALFWGLLLLMFCCSGQSASVYMLGQNNGDPMMSYSCLSNAKTLLENASFVGSNVVLQSNNNLWDFLYECPNPIMSALFHGGWAAAIAVIVLEVVFIVSAGILIWKKENTRSLLEVVVYIAWLSLAIRVVGGILYTFGIPVPITLPFTGEVGIIIDSIAMGLLILNCLVEKLREYMTLEEIEDDSETAKTEIAKTETTKTENGEEKRIDS